MKNFERCKILLENMPAVTWITNRDRSEYYISPSVQNVLGYPLETILSPNMAFWESHIHKEDRDRAIRAVNELFTHKHQYSVYFRIQHHDGHWIWLCDRVVSYITEGGEEYALGMLLDVTEQRNTENQLMESQKRFFDLAENSTDWFWEFDEQNIFTYSSPGVTRILGFEPEEVVGRSAFDFIPSPEKEKVDKEFSQSKDVHAPFSNLENINQHKDGHLVSIESSGCPIFDSEGNFRGYRGIDRDITTRKQMEAQLLHAQKMDAIGVLAGGIAHDFNNILASIMGFADLLELSVDKNDKATQYISGIQKASERARQLIQQILTFGKKIKHQPIQVNLEEMVDETISFLRATIPATIHINKERCCDDTTIFTDSTTIHQVLVNLCTNAAHAIGDTHGRINISVCTRTLPDTTLPQPTEVPPGEYLELIVEDNGGGIPLDHLPKIFDPYFTTKKKGKGAGLGLSVVHGIVTQQGGMITVDTEEGTGTTFHIFLPKRTVAPSLLPEENIEEEYPGNGQHILFVDDEPLLAQVQQLSLESMGYRVTAITSSTDALKKIQTRPRDFDLLITDQTMPNLTGEELADAFADIRTDIPIIICSGFNDDITEHNKLRVKGMRTYMTKPIERDILARTIYDYFHYKNDS